MDIAYTCILYDAVCNCSLDGADDEIDVITITNCDVTTKTPANAYTNTL